MRIAIVGGTGFVGRAIAEEVLRRGHRATVIHRGTRPGAPAGAEEAIAARAGMRGVIERARPDRVIDGIAMTARDALDLVRAIPGIPAIVLSSQDVYAQFGRLNGHPAPPPEERVREDAPATVPYPFRGIARHEGGDDYDKKDVERVIAEACADGRLPGATILRLPAIYGRGDRKRRLGAIVDAIDAGARTLPHRGGASFRWTHADVDDVARAIVLAAERDAAGATIWNVGEDETPTMRARAEALARAMGVEIGWRESEQEIEGGLSVLDRMANDFVADDAAIRAALGWRERDPMGARMSRLVDALRASRPS